MADESGVINKEPISPFVQVKREEGKSQAIDPKNESKLSSGMIRAVQTGHGVVESSSQLISPEATSKQSTVYPLNASPEARTQLPPTPEELKAKISPETQKLVNNFKKDPSGQL